MTGAGAITLLDQDRGTDVESAMREANGSMLHENVVLVDMERVIRGGLQSDVTPAGSTNPQTMKSSLAGKCPTAMPADG